METITGNIILLLIIIALIGRAMVFEKGYRKGVQDTIKNYHTNPNIE